MSSHTSPARASGSNPPAAMPGLEHTECDGTPLSLEGRLLDMEAKLKSIEFRFERHAGVTESRVLQECYAKYGNPIAPPVSKLLNDPLAMDAIALLVRLGYDAETVYQAYSRKG